jgi:small conductance mechanosensitive channel
VVLGLFLIMALQNLGVELLPLIAGLGIAGAGIALAMQGVLGNMVAGLTIIFSRPFRVGDYISIVKEEGEVLEIKLFNTTLGHPDLSHVVIPNRKIVGEILHNYGKIRQHWIEVGVAYDSDVGAAVKVAEEALRANPRVLKDPAPVVRVVKLADSCVVIAAAPWVSVPDYGVAGGELHQAILDAFRKRNIAIPFPQREIRMAAGAARAYLGSA